MLGNETILVDCYALRDHSWGPRSDAPGPSPTWGSGESLARRPAPYLWGAASEKHTFFVMGQHSVLVRDGERADLPNPEQRIDRDPTGRPTHIVVTGDDTAGRRLHAEGEVLSAIARPSGSSNFGWVCYVEWDIDGDVGPGDVQDIWPIGQWREYRRWAREPRQTGL